MGGASQLFISFIKPHRLQLLQDGAAGIDTTIFKPHSVRGASTSAAANSGITTEDILKAADWSTD